MWARNPELGDKKREAKIVPRVETPEKEVLVLRARATLYFTFGCPAGGAALYILNLKTTWLIPWSRAVLHSPFITSISIHWIINLSQKPLLSMTYHRWSH